MVYQPLSQVELGVCLAKHEVSDKTFNWTLPDLYSVNRGSSVISLSKTPSVKNFISVTPCNKYRPSTKLFLQISLLLAAVCQSWWLGSLQQSIIDLAGVISLWTTHRRGDIFEANRIANSLSHFTPYFLSDSGCNCHSRDSPGLSARNFPSYITSQIHLQSISAVKLLMRVITRPSLWILELEFNLLGQLQAGGNADVSNWS